MLKGEGMGKARFMILLLIRFDDIDDTILLSSGFTELMALEGTANHNQLHSPFGETGS